MRVKEKDIVIVEKANMENEYNKKFIKTIVESAVDIAGMKIAAIPTFLLTYSDLYQRDTDDANKLLNGWDINMLEALTVSYRDGKFWVINGKHRLNAAINKKIEFLPCRILVGLTEKEEAKIFAAQNDFVVTLKPVDKYKANIVANNEIDVFISDLSNKYGFTVSRSKNAGSLNAITTARRIASKRNGKNVLSWIIEVLSECGWLFNTNGMEACILDGLSYVFPKCKTRKEMNRIISVLSEFNPDVFKMACFCNGLKNDNKSIFSKIGISDKRRYVKEAFEGIIDKRYTKETFMCYITK